METPGQSNEILERIEGHLAAAAKSADGMLELQRRMIENQERQIRLYRRLATVVLVPWLLYMLWYAYSVWRWYAHQGGD